MPPCAAGIADRRPMPSAELLTGAMSVQLETAPGGHLGVLTGRVARQETWPLLDGFLAAA